MHAMIAYKRLPIYAGSGLFGRVRSHQRHHQVKQAPEAVNLMVSLPLQKHLSI